MRPCTAESSVAGVLLVTLLLTGCGEAPLPAPGAEQGGQITIWRPDAADPIRIIARRVVFIPESDQRLRLYEVDVGLSTEHGPLHLSAPWVSNDKEVAERDYRFGSPVHVHGWHGEHPFIGRAEEAWITTEQELVLHDLTLVRERRLLRSERYRVFRDGRSDAGQFREEPAPAHWQVLLPGLERHER